MKRKARGAKGDQSKAAYANLSHFVAHPNAHGTRSALLIPIELKVEGEFDFESNLATSSTSPPRSSTTAATTVPTKRRVAPIRSGGWWPALVREGVRAGATAEQSVEGDDAVGGVLTSMPESDAFGLSLDNN